MAGSVISHAPKMVLHGPDWPIPPSRQPNPRRSLTSSLTARVCIS